MELKGNRFGHAIYHPSFTAEVPMALKLRKGEGTQSDPSGSVREPVCLRTVNQSSVGFKKDIRTPRFNVIKTVDSLGYPGIFDGGGMGSKL